MKILLISDTHGWLDDAIRKEILTADEVWHAGDLGTGVLEELEKHKKFRAVFGNIDGGVVRQSLPENLFFETAGLRVLMRHITGTPGSYNTETKKLIQMHRPALLVSGHSHILHVRYYPNLGHLHINPGASGHHGFHTIRTAIRFKIEEGKPVSAEVLEWGKRGRS